MNTPQTDTPETEMTLQEQLIAAHRRIGIEHTEMQVQRDRAIAAEAKLAKWESELSKVMPADFKDWWQNSREEWPEVARMVIEGLRKNTELVEKAAEARVKEMQEAIRLAHCSLNQTRNCLNIRFNASGAKDSSDGSLLESINASIIKENLRELVQQ